MMKLDYTAHTHIGRRHNNEDALLACPDLGLFAVADGMGGYEGGEVASSLAIRAVADFVRANRSDADITWPYGLDHSLSFEENLARVGARLAHQEIEARRIGALAQMGSTLAMLLVTDAVAVVCHIGDSRAYRLRDGALSRLTVDHSMYEELLASGARDLPPRESFPYSNVITRALGITGKADVQSVAVAPGDVYLLCTDGLTELVAEQRIREALETMPLDAACAALVTEAYDAGGRDNITVVGVQCYE